METVLAAEIVRFTIEVRDIGPDIGTRCEVRAFCVRGTRFLTQFSR
jgi:hypothetical protein